MSLWCNIEINMLSYSDRVQCEMKTFNLYFEHAMHIILHEIERTRSYVHNAALINDQ